MIAVDSLILPVDYNTKRKSIWATGNLEKLVEKRENARATALMVNVDVLSPMQQEELFNVFEVPIFDRYNVVLNIFKEYAMTEEARLQIALAELPYIRSRIHALNSKRMSSKSEILHIAPQYVEYDGDLSENLRKREQEIRKQLKELSTEPENFGGGSDTATVAVVGYTNAGKTSLVKKLTGSASLDPKDRLFATLDTTRHFAKLPSGRKALFADTIGFLSDLPIHLISAFEATLAHVKFADVIVHLRDISNPDWRAQEEDVVSTLKSIGVDECAMQRKMITVDNKIDKCDEDDLPEESLHISCKSGQGFDDLISRIDEKVIEMTKCKRIRIKLDVRSPIIEWLYRNQFVINDPVADGNLLIFDVVLNESEIGKLKKQFSNLKKK